MAESRTVRRPSGAREIAADWALIGKKQGTERAYAVQAMSAGDREVSRYAWRYVTGNPRRDLPADAAGGLPWITVAGFDDAGPPVVSVSISDPWDGVDIDGRPILPRRLFVFSYPELAAASVSYQQLWQVLCRVELPISDGRPASVLVAPQPIDGLLATLSHYGFERLARLAALVLEGRIALAGAARLPREARLALLDAIMALLPYECRSAMAVGTAADNKVSHGLDIVFADVANDQTVVQLARDVPVPEPSSRLGREYLRLLTDRHGTRGPRELVAYLWQQTEPVSRENRAGALEILAKLDYDGSFQRELKASSITPEQACGFFRRDPAEVAAAWHSRGMTVDLKRRVLQLMLRVETTEAAGLLRPHWATVQPDLDRIADGGLDDKQPDLTFACLTIAGEAAGPYEEDGLLRTLIAAPRGGKRILGPRHDSLAALLRNYQPPQDGELALTREQIWNDADQTWQHRLFRKLFGGFLRESGHADLAVRWAHWVTGSPGGQEPRWIAVLRLAVGPGMSEDAGLGRGDPVWAAILLTLAARCERRRLLLPVIAADLLAVCAAAAAAVTAPGTGPRAVTERQALLDALRGDLWAAHVPAGTIAMADAARALLGGVPRDFPADQPGSSADDYLEGMHAALGQLGGEQRLAVATRVLDHAVPAGSVARTLAGGIGLLNMWSADQELRDVVADHILRLPGSARPVDAGLSSGYWDNLARSPELAAYVATQRLALAVREALADPERTLPRRPTATGLDFSALSVACRSVRQVGMPPADIIRVFHAHGAGRLTPQQLDRVLTDFQNLLSCQPGYGNSQALDDLYLCYQAIYAGGLGAAYATQFRAYLDPVLGDGAKLRLAWRKGLRKVRVIEPDAGHDRGAIRDGSGRER